MDLIIVGMGFVTFILGIGLLQVEIRKSSATIISKLDAIALMLIELKNR